MVALTLCSTAVAARYSAVAAASISEGRRLPVEAARRPPVTKLVIGTKGGGGGGEGENNGRGKNRGAAQEGRRGGRPSYAAE